MRAYETTPLMLYSMQGKKCSDEHRCCEDLLDELTGSLHSETVLGSLPSVCVQ